jgi:hypothetical protein
VRAWLAVEEPDPDEREAIERLKELDRQLSAHRSS